MSESDVVQKARQFVKMETNQVYEPVVFTSEVADELGISKDEACDALKASSHVNEKEVGGISVWW
ncbi:hypothetical protein [Natrialba aegyptia]|uniref:Uncharacterized protein n=1 Tax=Natrialba aegyptia DSM 13077 TaxID=1227491 RepID=M0B8F1_9EURY|nr:hypothetical protein [Natrialba aegyptia]ELZ06787.1 hypothetical protein C480_07137 [Natrialba aegyptia DSM 13077]